jgi:hypothetical protein
MILRIMPLTLGRQYDLIFIKIINAYQLDRFSASVIMSVVYDYNILSYDDAFLNVAKRTLDLFARVATPEKAALFGAFPFRKCLEYCDQA